MWYEIKDFPKLDLSMYVTEARFRFLTIDRDERFTKMHEQMPFFADKFSIFRFEPKEEWSVHVDMSFDNSRLSTLNFPLYEMPFDSITHFYKFNTDTPKITSHLPGKFISYSRDSCEEIGSMVLKQPSVINVSIPHDAWNLENKLRYVLSWSSRLPWDETAARVQEWADTQTVFPR